MLEKPTDIAAYGPRLNVVEDEYLSGCQRSQQWAAESRRNVPFWSTGDEELDLWDFGNRLSKHQKDSGLRVFVLALVEGVDHNHGRNTCGSEGLDQKVLHLVSERFVNDVGIGLEERDERGSEVWVSLGKLECQGWEDKVKVTTILETSRTEE